MSKKTKPFRKSRTPKYYSSSRNKKINRETDTLENLILSRLYTSQKPLKLNDLKKSTDISKGVTEKLENALHSLLSSNFIKKDSRNSYSIQVTAPLYEGVVEQNPRGFGFVAPTNQTPDRQIFTKDIYIAASKLGQSHHGDRVLVRVLHVKKAGRPEGAVVSILKAGPDTVAGTLIKKHGEHLVYPDDSRFPFVVKVETPKKGKVNNGDCVVVRYKNSDSPTGVLNGEIIEIIGSPKDAKTQRRLVIEKFHLPHHFNKEIKKELQNINQNFSSLDGREDLRDTAHITIDGEDSKDFDDAIWVTQTAKGYRLFVSIADVSYFVQPGSNIDKEAYVRGTSVYFPNFVIPMLPEKLSNDLCSLNPNSDRYTVTAILDFDKNAKLQKKRFCRSIIQSKYRFTYSIVSKILVDKDPELRKQHNAFIEQFEVAEKLATQLKRKRRRRGSIDFNLSEPLFTLSADGEIASIEKTERSVAHQIIEEFMLAANEAVADYFSEQCSTALYRIHELPDQEKLDQFLKFATTLDLNLPPKEQSSQFLARILENAQGGKNEYIINNLLLRSLKQAHYSTKNVGHFGLSSQNYTHFTSPIRRYPDLLVHRHLLSLISSPKSRSFAVKPSLQESGEFLSKRERVAVVAERDMNNRLKVLYMTQFIGHQFEAIISGVSENGLFIEIQDLCVSGAISIDFLTDDYYLFDQKQYRLFGEISARTYQIGDSIKVVLIEANLNKQKLHFSPVSQ